MIAMRFLVTAGNTRERIDDVRDWGNIFTGNTGLAIAQALSAAGDVDLLTSNQNHIQSIKADRPAIQASPFSTHAELKGALAALVPRQRYDAIFMTAAVSDYQPGGVYSVERRDIDNRDIRREVWTVRDVQAAKVKGNWPLIAVLGRPTEKVVDLFRTDWNYKGVLVKFKLEVGISSEQLLEVGQASRIASGADYLVANTLEMVRGRSPGAFLLSEGRHEWIERPRLPQRMLELATGAK
jgi:phosphopantothenoylcysteine synthetase/decarboxylase